MSVWLSVQQVASELKCSQQYVRYLISGRKRIYPNRVVLEKPRFNENEVEVVFNGKRVKYNIHNSAMRKLINIKNAKSK